MPIEGFDYQGFAQALSSEAGQVVPRDVDEQDRQYITNIVHQFCHMAGEALFNDTALNFNAQQASIITQFIGEWAFHKSIDLIRSGIAPQFRDGVLQKVAFTVFEISKQAMAQNMPQNQMIQIVEHHVKKSFKEALDELANSGALSAEEVQNASGRSNIDDMAKEMKQDSAVANASDSKILKLAAIAMLMRKMPQEKIVKMLQKFNQNDAQILIEYIQMPDLENKLDKGIAQKCLHEIKMSLPEPKRLSFEKVYSKLYNIVKNSDKTEVSAIIEEERLNIRRFVLSPFEEEVQSLPSRVADIIYEHIGSKIH